MFGLGSKSTGKTSLGSPLLDPVSSSDVGGTSKSKSNSNSNSVGKNVKSPLATPQGNRSSGERYFADILADTAQSHDEEADHLQHLSRKSRHSIKELDDGARSRLIFSSSFSHRFTDFVNPNNTAQLTTFLLLNSMIGSGILNQPYVFKESGIIGGIVGFLLATVATWTGLMCLTSAGIQEDIWEYSGLAFRAFEKNGERVVDIAIIVLTFGSQLGYILVVGTTLSGLLKSWGCDLDVCGNTPITIVSVAVFVTPVCMFRHFGHLAYLSVFSIVTIFAVMGLVMIGGPIKHQVDHVDSDYQYFNAYGMLASLGSIVFSLDCASSNFQAFISTEEKSQNLPSWFAVTRNAVISGSVMCMIMGLVGYLSFGDDTEGEILDNFQQAGYDIFKVMVVIHLILYIPSNFVIMRYSVVKLFSGERSELLPKTTHTLITIVLLAITVSTVVALLQMKLSSGLAFSLILNITGGIGGKEALSITIATCTY